MGAFQIDDYKKWLETAIDVVLLKVQLKILLIKKNIENSL